MSRFDTRLYYGIQTFTTRKTSGSFTSTRIINSLTNPNFYSTGVQGRIPDMVRSLAQLQPTLPTPGGIRNFQAFATETITANSSPQPVQFADITTARGCSFINAIVTGVSANTIFLSVLVQVTFNTIFGGQRIIPFTVEIGVPTRCQTTPTQILIQSVECRLAGNQPTITSSGLLGTVIIALPINILATVRFDCTSILTG